MYSLKNDSDNFDKIWYSLNPIKQLNEQSPVTHKGYNNFYNARKSIPYYDQMSQTNKVKSEFDLINRRSEQKGYTISKGTCTKESLNFKEQFDGNKKDYLSVTAQNMSNNLNNNYENVYLTRKFNNETLRSSIEKHNTQFYSLNDYQIQKEQFYQNKTRERSKFDNVKLDKNQQIFRQNVNFYNSSDIFNNRQMDQNIIKKSGEKSMFTHLNKAYTSNSPSYSDWHPSYSKQTLFNHTNSEQHLLNPLIKTTSRLKREILQKEDLEHITHRQKGISEFCDITRNGSPNPNREFLKVFKGNKSPFNKTKNICSEYAFMSHNYKDLCGPAYGKKN